MPQYDHTCEKCKKDFVVEMKMSEVGEKKVSCPECGSKKVSRNVTNKTFWSESIDRYNYSKTQND
jgi:putative FmdB family regulatory protein